MPDLLVDRRLRDQALLNVLHQPAVPPDKTDVQLLLRLVPLAPHHHPVPIPIRLRTRNHRSNDVPREPADPLEQVGHLLPLHAQLRPVLHVLVLAAAAPAEVRARRRHTLRRRLDHPQQPGAREILLHLHQLRLDGFANERERDEHNKIIKTANAFAAERDVRNCQLDCLTNNQRHA